MRRPVLRRRRPERGDGQGSADVRRAALEHGLELALEAGQMGVWSWDPRTGAVHWSESMERLFGLAPGTFDGTLEASFDFVHPDDRQTVSERMARALPGSDPGGLEYRILRADGAVRWIEMRSRPAPDGSGAFVGVAVDVTERREAEDELRNREAAARLALDAGGMGSWRWDRETNDVLWSPELERLFGLEPGSFPATFEAFLERVHPDDRERVLGVIGSAVERGGHIATEHRIVLPDGSVRWIEGRGYAVPGADDTLWIGVGIDITERKQAETERARLHALERTARANAEHAGQELEGALARLDTLLEHAPVGFGFYDTELRFVRLNEPLAEIHGLPVEAHIGRTAAEVAPRLWEQVQPVFSRVLETGEAVVDHDVTGQTAAAPGIERHWLVSVYPVSGASGERLGLGTVVLDITGRKRAERVARLVARASEVFASSVDLEVTLDQAVRLPIPDFADSCHLFLLEPDGRDRRVALADVDPALESLLAETDRRFPVDLAGELPMAKALREGRSEYIADVTDAMLEAFARDAEHLALLRRHGVSSSITTPLKVGDQRVGVLVLTYRQSSGRRYRRSDVALAEELARRFAQVIERAKLSGEAERARARLDLLARAGELLTVELDATARLERMANVVVPSFADVAIVHLTRHDGDLGLAHVAFADAERRARFQSVGEWPPLAIDGPAPQAEAVRTGRPALLAEVPEGLVDQVLTDRQREFALSLGIRSIVACPLLGPDGPFGAISFALAGSGRRYGPEDVPLAEELARRAASGVAHALRFEQEQATAETLQRSLLLERLPTLPEVELAARYVPGSEELKVGGDWYDVVPLPNGRVMLAIGDVVGHGVRAAVAMGKIRNALQFCALDGLAPGAILRRLNQYFCGLEDAAMATLLVLVHDPADATLRFSSAGHPPPLLQRPGEALEYLPGGRGAPLCASDTSRYPEVEAELAPGSLLLLYTDGLIERRQESLDEGFRRLAEAVAHAPEKLDELADHVLAELLGGKGPEDDVALLAFRSLARSEGLELRLPARPRELAVLRARLRDWLARAAAAPTEAGEITLAVDEAAANAVEHAYGLGDGDFSVEAHPEGDDVVVVVRDWGEWRDPAPRAGGRGASLMRSLMDDVQIESGPGGTEVRMRRRLRRERGG
jgi:PAS domain S-box-containing protein